ncbi:gliding motility-associated C-terminal domain-containing protein [Mucilaginibacter jinjuensis]|uniref:Gliding motility-associated C-terminal domain-containing protein n=1 Tax=Mucilaginibacter jinjuensis TaxID=1176721 RepID=A0ABY7TA36_9SPHI|nr:gliding motility-associated C-terminal domain-containing protein [Mucilaginibacter jinjuensis]WCT12801.1 gliding motility-associated C-terminal domain-containing protein [Mucilaginibacter jinjuensis]
MHKVLLFTFMLILFNAAYGQQRLVYNNKFFILDPIPTVSIINNNAVTHKKTQGIASPVINVGPLSGTIKTCAHVASTTFQQFTISGDNLTSDLQVSAPYVNAYDDTYTPPTFIGYISGFEISTTPNDPASFSHLLTLPQVNGKVATITIYVRMSADNVHPNYPAIIEANTDGIPSKNIYYGDIKGSQTPLPDVDVSNQTICNNTLTAKITFKGRSEETTGKSYTWVNDNTAIGLAANGTGDIPSFIGKNSGTEPLRANVTVTPVGDCMGMPQTFHIVVNPTLHPVLTVSTLTPIVCTGATITFTATPKNVGDLPIYKWLINGKFDGGNTITGDNTLVYTSDKLKNGDKVTCTVTGATYCYTPVTSDPFTVNMIPLPQVHFDNSSYTIYPGQSVQLNAIANSSVNGYSWSPTTGLSNPGIANPIARPSETTLYKLTTSTAGGCTADASVTVNVVPRPDVYVNVFTPNGDGVNDTWTVPKLVNFPNCSVKIYNRYGGLVYQSIGYSKPWDGTFKSKPLPVGSYYYLIDLNTGDPPISGYVCILR